MRQIQNRYSDIMYQPRPRLKRRMERAHRAKQFAPFAALKGYEEAVAETAVSSEHSWDYEKVDIQIS